MAAGVDVSSVIRDTWVRKWMCKSAFIFLHFPLLPNFWLLSSSSVVVILHISLFHFHIISKSLPVLQSFFCLPTLEMETCCLCVSMWKRKLELDTTLFHRNTIQLLSPQVPNAPLLSSVQLWGTSGRCRVLSCYWIWGSDKKNQLLKIPTTTPSPNLLTPSFVLWLLYFHISISCLSLSPLRLKHLLSDRGLGRRHDVLKTAWLAHFKADSSSMSEPDLEYCLTPLFTYVFILLFFVTKKKKFISPPDSEVSLKVCQTAQDCLQTSPQSVDAFSHGTVVDERKCSNQLLWFVSIIMCCSRLSHDLCKIIRARILLSINLTL